MVNAKRKACPQVAPAIEKPGDFALLLAGLRRNSDQVIVKGTRKVPRLCRIAKTTEILLRGMTERV